MDISDGSSMDEDVGNPIVDIQSIEEYTSPEPTLESDSGTLGDLEYGPHIKLSRREDSYMLKPEINIVKEKKFICSLDLMLQIFMSCCQSPGCANVPHVKHHFIGTTLVVNSSCQDGHNVRFCSSHEVNGMYANNLQAAAAILLSGNNFAKISKMAEFMCLAFPSTSTFFRMQRLYFYPVVEEWWTWMRSQLVEEFVGKKVVVAGDGQCDSPGFSAKNLCYFLMEDSTRYILEVQVRDKRHVGLSSTNMEKEGLKMSLDRLSSVLDIVELTTDASASIKKMMG